MKKTKKRVTFTFDLIYIITSAIIINLLYINILNLDTYTAGVVAFSSLFILPLTQVALHLIIED